MRGITGKKERRWAVSYGWLRGKHDTNCYICLPVQKEGGKEMFRHVVMWVPDQNMFNIGSSQVVEVEVVAHCG